LQILFSIFGIRRVEEGGVSAVKVWYNYFGFLREGQAVGERGEKKKNITKYLAAGLGGLAVGGFLLYKTLFSPGDVLHEKPGYKGVEEKSAITEVAKKTPGVEGSYHLGPNSDTLTVEDVEKIRTLPEKERKAALREILKHKKPPKPGLKPYLDGLAWIDEEGWIYPDGVEKDEHGRYLYDFTNPEHVVLARWEAYNNREPPLFAKVDWRSASDRKELAINDIQNLKNESVDPLHRYKILKIKKDGNIVYVDIWWDGLYRPRHKRLAEINGELEFF
jgi:hypothetical protein